MRRLIISRGSLCLFCVFVLLVGQVTAANITITSGQSVYYFLTGQPVVIPLSITNNYSQQINGTLVVSSDQELQKPGEILIRTENRVLPTNISPGIEALNSYLASSDEPTGYRVHISYDYAEPDGAHISLPEIIVRIVSLTAEVQDNGSPLQSSSGPKIPDVPVTSSVSIREANVNARQQIGSDSTGGLPSQGGSGGLNGTGSREQQDQDLAAFSDYLDQDPFFSEINQSLISQGFTLRSFDPRTSGNNSGTFTDIYTRGTGDQAILGGSMAAGNVTEVVGQSNAVVNISSSIASNTSVNAYVQDLARDRFQFSGISFVQSPANATTNMSYSDATGHNAFILATETSGNVSAVELIKKSDSLDPLVIVIAGILLITGIAYFRFFRKKSHKTDKPHEMSDTIQAYNPEKGIEILTAAQEAYNAQRYAKAYSLVGQALRAWLSVRFNEGREMTTPEALSLMRTMSFNDIETMEHILERVETVAFARNDTEPGEFEGFTEFIRDLIHR